MSELIYQSASKLARAIRERQVSSEEVVRAFEAPPHNATNDAANFPGFSYTAVFNVTGWTAAVVRGGTAQGGLPIGGQIVGGPWREAVVLAVARCLEDALGEWPRPYLWSLEDDVLPASPFLDLSSDPHRL